MRKTVLTWQVVRSRTCRYTFIPIQHSSKIPFKTPAGFQAGIAAEEPVKLVLSPSSDSRQPQWEVLARAKDFGVLEVRWEVVTGYEEVGPHCCLRVAQVDERPGADFAVEQRRHAEPYSSSSEA